MGSLVIVRLMFVHGQTSVWCGVAAIFRKFRHFTDLVARFSA
jgi:hypothetical protein